MADYPHKTTDRSAGAGPSRSQILALVTLLPVSATLLFLAGVTLTGTLIGLAVATPVFVIFSPVIVPAALVIGLAVLGFLTSGAFGITALSSLSWMANYLRRIRGSLPQQIDQAKRRAQEMTGHMGQKARDMGQAAQTKAQEAAGK
ncbi:oleosin H2-like [Euphorbia lathyris]|uniref:oleosin H2-like n=1 Tax=Euphorbia lathyris TaxID=212925 RepID=UPI0033144C74